MICTELTLIRKNIVQDKIGVEKEEETLSEPIPIMKIEDVYANEFYEANEQGFKPSLRLKISMLNYNEEEELIYKNVRYSIIRKQEQGDELVLICERKLKNVKKN